MEVVALKGTVGELRHFADHVLALRGVYHAQLVLTADESQSASGAGAAGRRHAHPHRRERARR
jgi:CopG family nickel-responsive transcriptional regulator